MVLTLRRRDVPAGAEGEDLRRRPAPPRFSEARRRFGFFVVANDLIVVLVLWRLEIPLLAVCLLSPLLLALRRRPQRGVILLAGLVPYDGLLILLHHHSSTVRSWKEAVVVVTLIATFLCPSEARASVARRTPQWLPPLVALVVLGALSAAQSGIHAGITGFRIDFFYVLVALAIWRCPLRARDRDRLVTVLMVNAWITAIYGLVQQVLGAARLASLGYQYNETIRTTGGHLRSFSTFEQPFPFAYYLMLVILVGLPLALCDTGRMRNRIFLLSMPVLVAATAFTFVRGAWLGLAAGGAYLMLRRHHKLLLVVPVLVLIGLYLPGSLVTSSFQSQSLGQRSTGWRSNLGRLVDHPLGSGIGTTGAAAAVVAGSNTADPKTTPLVTSTSTTYQPDNYYYKTIYELGILGAWLLVLVLCFALSTASRLVERARGPTSAFALGVAAFTVAAMTASLVSTFFEIFPMDFFFWLLTGVMASLDRVEETARGTRAVPAWSSA